MHKPHDYPLRIRFWHFLRGLLFYNTVYWKRASDDLKPPRLSREERASLQPAPDPDIVRPRERPRAKPLPETRAPATPRLPGAFVPPSPDPLRGEIPIPVAPAELRPREKAAHDPLEPEKMVKRRRYRRRSNKPKASRSAGLLALQKAEGLLARLFGPKS